MIKLIKRIRDFIAGLDFDGSSEQFKYATLPSTKISKIASINLQKDDVIVLYSGSILSDTEKTHIQTQYEKIFPNNKLLILDNGNRLAVWE